MPLKNGLQTTQEIKNIYEDLNKQHPERFLLKPPKVVILTAFKTLGFETYLKQFGITECYEKPMELDLLCGVIQRLIEQQVAETDLVWVSHVK